MPGYANRAAARAAGRASGVGRKMNASMQRVHNDISAAAKPVTQATSAAERQAAGEGGSGRIWPYVAGGAVAGGGLLAYRHHNRKKKAVSKNLVAVPVSKGLKMPKFGKKPPEPMKPVGQQGLGPGITYKGPGQVGMRGVKKGLFGDAVKVSVKNVKSDGLKSALKAEGAAFKSSFGTSYRAARGGAPYKQTVAASRVGKASTSEWGTNIRSVQPRTPNGRYVSHENKLEVVHVHPRGIKNSKLEAYGRGVGRRLQ